MKSIKLSLLIFVLCVNINIADAGRARISLIEEGVYSREDIEKEILFGREMSAIILADRPLVPNAKINKYLNLVGRSILLHANRPELEFYFALVESPQINAYAAPGVIYS